MFSDAICYRAGLREGVCHCYAKVYSLFRGVCFTGRHYSGIIGYATVTLLNFSPFCPCLVYFVSFEITSRDYIFHPMRCLIKYLIHKSNSRMSLPGNEGPWHCYRQPRAPGTS
jgi:hypothetical protein